MGRSGEDEVSRGQVRLHGRRVRPRSSAGRLASPPLSRFPRLQYESFDQTLRVDLVAFAGCAEQTDNALGFLPTHAVSQLRIQAPYLVISANRTRLAGGFLRGQKLFEDPLRPTDLFLLQETLELHPSKELCRLMVIEPDSVFA